MIYQKLKSQKGMTLVEIIVAITILGIIIVGLLGMYRLTSSQIFVAGHRTDKVLDARAIVDDLVAQDDIVKFTSVSQADMYLAGKGYHGAISLDDIKIKDESTNINYYIGAECIKAGVSGYEVIILFFIDDVNYVQLTTFIIKGGGI